MGDPFDFSDPRPQKTTKVKSQVPPTTKVDGPPTDKPGWRKSSKEAKPADLADDEENALAEAKSDVKTAQGLMLFIGVLGFGLNLYLLANLDNEIAEAQAMVGQISKAKIDQVRVAYFMASWLSLLFVFLGLLIWWSPLVITIAVFLLYLVGNLVFMTLTAPPEGGAIFAKVFFAIAFGRAISHAAAYERAKRVLERSQGTDEDEADNAAGAKGPE